MTSLLKGLAEESVFMLKSSVKLPFSLKGIVRLIDTKGRTLGLVLDREIMEEIEEEIEAQNPDFIDSLEASRRSGRVSSKEIKKKLGIK